MLLIKNDPKYNEQWPRALVPYKRIYGIDEPSRLTPLANDGKRSPHLPEGTPFGLVGTSSLYKRESYPHGGVPDGQGHGDLSRAATIRSRDWARWPTPASPATGSSRGPTPAATRTATSTPSASWSPSRPPIRATPAKARRLLVERRQRTAAHPRRVPGAQVRPRLEGKREPTPRPRRQSRHQLPGEDPRRRRLDVPDAGQERHGPEHGPDLAPGAARRDPQRLRRLPCPQPEADPLRGHRRRQAGLSGLRPDEADAAADDEEARPVRQEVGREGRQPACVSTKGVKNVEYYRDVKPILDRSCVACHTQKVRQAGRQPGAGRRRTDARTADRWAVWSTGPPGKVPGTYFRLALDHAGQFGHKSPVGNWSHPQASRYVRMFQSRRSLLIWKIFGKRLDGWSNDDFATETVPGDPNSLAVQGQAARQQAVENRRLINLAYTGSVMPPPEAVAGTYDGPDGKKIKVAPLTDEDRRPWCAGSTSAARSISITTRPNPRHAATAGCRTTTGRR